tara:strand:- start:679 stop:1179 length:501 start_codon:yes stop_codon:yes gene_type:complete
MNIAIDKKERTVQNVFDDKRENNNRIEEIKEELECLKEELKNRKKLQPGFKEELKSLQKDLLKEKKLEWIECNLNEWREYVEKNREDDPVKYYIYRYDGGIRQQGFYKGEFKLNVKDEEHFREYFDDYFYYGCPNYQDKNHPNADGSECYLAFGGGSAYVQSFEWD